MTRLWNLWDIFMFFTGCMGRWHMYVRMVRSQRRVCVRCGRGK